MLLMCVHVFVLQLARPMCMVPNIPGIPGPPMGGSSSGSSSPSGYSIHSEAKMVSSRLLLDFYLFIWTFCPHVHPADILCSVLFCSFYYFLLQLLSVIYVTLNMQPHQFLFAHYMTSFNNQAAALLCLGLCLCTGVCVVCV